MCHLENGCRDVSADINAAEDSILLGCVAVSLGM